MNKHWTIRSPATASARWRACAGVCPDRPGRSRSGDRARAHGRSHRHRLPPLHPQRQPVHADADATASVDTEISNQQSGCGLIMTEFTSADGLSRMRESKRKRYLTFYDDEHPISAQLFGSNPARLREAARSSKTPASTWST